MILYSGGRCEPSTKFGGQFVATPTLVDIALGLGRTPRFGGQSRRWWSGLHHALVCRAIADRMGLSERVQLLALLHDAHEAVTGDVPAFFKPKVLSAFQEEIDERLYKGMGLWPITEPEHLAIKVVDDRALKAEAYVVGPPNIMSHLGEPEPQDIEVVDDAVKQLPSPLDTDGVNSKAAEMFYTNYARLIGDAVVSRRDDTNRN